MASKWCGFGAFRCYLLLLNVFYIVKFILERHFYSFNFLPYVCTGHIGVPHRIGCRSSNVCVPNLQSIRCDWSGSGRVNSVYSSHNRNSVYDQAPPSCPLLCILKTIYTVCVDLIEPMCPSKTRCPQQYFYNKSNVSFLFIVELKFVVLSMPSK